MCRCWGGGVGKSRCYVWAGSVDMVLLEGWGGVVPSGLMGDGMVGW